MKENKINQWLENSYKKIPNSEVVVIIIDPNTREYNLYDLQRASNNYLTNKGRPKVIMLDTVPKYNYFKNTIVVTSAAEYQSFEHIKKIVQQDVILIDDVASIKKIINLLQNEQLDYNSEIKYELLEKYKFEDILDLDTIAMKEFIRTRSYLLRKLNIYFKDIDIEYINASLSIYEQRKVLLAGFVQSLYRLATLDFISTDKRVGGTIHKTLGVGSKTMNWKYFKVKMPLTMMKNHRVYDLNENQIERKIKTEIAKKLVALESKKLDIEKIANITELPLKDVEKIYTACFIR